MPRIGVTISGGGHRAALFGLGALLYLVDSGKARELTSIASVSGGSLTNGYLAQSIDLHATDPERFHTAIKPLARRLARTGTFWPPSALTVGYLVLVALSALAMIGVWFDPSPLPWRLAQFAVALIVFGVVASLRGLVVSRALAKTLFSPAGSATRLDGCHKSIDHVICAADLHAGENVYFTPRFVCSYRFGWGEPGNLPLHVAVQCSAALPGAMPPRWLRTSRHHFIDPRPEAQGASRMALVDGGVYDNMADQWTLGLEARGRRWPAHAAQMRGADETIIVNASASPEWSRVWPARIPVIGDVVALLKDKSVLYDNGNSVRRELAVLRFGATNATGALVHIAQSPLRIPRAFADRQDEMGERANDIIRRLEHEESAWDEQVTKSAAMGTTLWGFSGTEGAALLRHGYALAMANLHVLLGYDPRDVPDLSWFSALID